MIRDFWLSLAGRLLLRCLQDTVASLVMNCMLEHLAVPELSSAPPLLMPRMKMVQLSKWLLVPPTLRDCGTVILRYLQFLFHLCSSLAS